MDGEVDGWYFPSLDGVPVPGPRTIVLIGRKGNGKSATGNSILGKRAFKSGSSILDITNNLECQSTTLKNGEFVNVIDTPGLVDVGSEFVSKEIVKCLDLAKDGIHAMLLVLSVSASLRFTEEETAVIMRLQATFGPDIAKYMIVVFTGGDYLEKDQSLEDFLSYGCPNPLWKILHACKKRVVMFDNNTKDKKKKASQRQKLLSLVDKVVEENGGKPYTKSLFSAFKAKEEEANASNEQKERRDPIELMEKMEKSYDEQLKQMMEMFESKLKETNEKFQRQLNEEKAARLEAEKIAQNAIAQFESKLKETNHKLQRQLSEEKTARLIAEKVVKDAQKDEIERLKNSLAIAYKKSEDGLKEVKDNLQMRVWELSRNLQKHLDDEEAAARRLKEKKKIAQDEERKQKERILSMHMQSELAKAKRQEDMKRFSYASEWI